MSENIKEGLLDGEELTVTIMLEDNTSIDCVVLSIFEVEDREYIAVIPDDENADEVYLYRYVELENGDPELTNIESDEEYKMVADIFAEILDEAEYQDMVEEGEE